MTEDEAKTKWCPFAFKIGTLTQPMDGGHDQIVASGGQNRGWAMGAPIPACLCIASACMAWRWTAWDRNAAVQMGADFEARASEARPGFCGLAGAPS